MAVGHLAGILGTILLFTPSASDRETSRALAEVAEAGFTLAGSDPALARGPYDFFDTVTGGLAPQQRIAWVERLIAAYRNGQNPFLGWALIMMVLMRLNNRDVAGARRACLEAELFAEANGAEYLRTEIGPLEAVIELADVKGSKADSLEKLEDCWTRILEKRAAIAGQWAVNVCHMLLDRGLIDEARLWNARAQARPVSEIFTSWQSDALEPRLEIRMGDTDVPVDDIGEVIGRFRRAGREYAAGDLAFRSILDLLSVGEGARADDIFSAHEDVIQPARKADIASQRDAGPAPPTSTPSAETDGEETLRLFTPRIELLSNGDVRTMSGFGARLLAFLVAGDGVVETDRAVDLLWPDAAPDEVRNRLYVVLHRIRKALGYTGESVLYLEAGMLHFDPGDDAIVDVWSFDRAVQEATPSAPTRLTKAVLAFVGDFCEKQFAYDDFAIEARRRFRTMYERVALQALEVHLSADDGKAAETVALHVAEHGSEDETLTLLAVESLMNAGRRGLARKLLDRAVVKAEQLGFESAELVERGRQLTS